MKKIVSLFLLSIFALSFLVIPKAGAQPLIDDITSDVEQDQVRAEDLEIIPDNITFTAKPDRTYIYDWYIKDFQTEITVNKDSSLDITEKIVADCGDAYDKHGIFRVLPTVYYKEENKPIKAPIELISITDFEGAPYNYTTIKNSSDKTITWKIGDKDIVVTGVNNYLIKYRVQNAVRFESPNFDEFYWNLSGNFWDLEIDNFSAKIIFPEEVSSENTEVNNYIGSYGTSTDELLDSRWVEPNVLQISTSSMLPRMVGITTSVTFPKNIFSPYVPGFWEEYGVAILGFIMLFIPVLVLFACFKIWRKYGDDKPFSRSIAPEFEIPEKMDPIRMGVFMENGKQNTRFLSAAIVNLAVKGFIKMEKIEKKGLLGAEDTRLIKLGKSEKDLNTVEKELVDGLFGAKSEVLVSDLKNKFYKNLPMIHELAKSDLVAKNYFEKKGFEMQNLFWGIAGVLFVATFFAPPFLASLLGGVGVAYAYFLFISCMVVFAVFGFFMPKRSEEGQDLLLRIRGLKMYMKTAERYRQKFNEKENIFERFLPYAMLFGIVGLWTKKMKMLYGEEYFTNYHPIWYAGTFHDGAFNIDGFTSQLNSISSSMASTMSSSPSSSGSGGGGFSGGGGGGGGGGGW